MDSSFTTIIGSSMILMGLSMAVAVVCGDLKLIDVRRIMPPILTMGSTTVSVLLMFGIVSMNLPKPMSNKEVYEAASKEFQW